MKQRLWTTERIGKFVHLMLQKLPINHVALWSDITEKQARRYAKKLKLIIREPNV